MSPFEFICVTTNSSPSPCPSPTAEKIRSVIADHPSFENFLQETDLEQTAIGSGKDLLAFQNGKGKRVVIPSRALESIHFFGDSNLSGDFRERAIDQLRDISQADIKNFADNFYWGSKREILDCIAGKRKEPVDLETGRLIFDPERKLKIKYTLLRPVQYKLLYCLMQIAKDLPKELLLEIPNNIADRLIWYYNHRMINLSRAQIGNLVSAYTKCLEWYLAGQEAFETSGNTQMSVDCDELRGAAKTIGDFVKNGTLHPPKLPKQS